MDSSEGLMELRHKDKTEQPAEPLYYIRDARSDVGNCILWWCPEGKGYTCELNKAGKFTKEQAFGRRDTDIPVPCEVAETAAILHVRSDIPAMRDYKIEKNNALLQTKVGASIAKDLKVFAAEDGRTSAGQLRYLVNLYVMNRTKTIADLKR